MMYIRWSLKSLLAETIVCFCINLTRERTVGNPSAIEGQTVNIKNLRTGLWASCSTSLPLNSKGLWRVSWPRRNAASDLPRTFHKYLTIVCFCINLTRERTVGNPSVIEGQTVNIKNLRTWLWAWCSTSLPLNSKGLWRVSWPRRNAASDLPRTFHKYLTIVCFCINLTCERTVGNPSAIEGQTVNIKNLRTGLWAWCSTSLPLNSKGLWRVSWPRRNAVSDLPRTFHKYLTIVCFCINLTCERTVGNPSAIASEAWVLELGIGSEVKKT